MATRTQPTPRRRTDGFSDDMLSYSAATDFDRKLGEALAQIEARTKNPRYVPGALVERPDAPDLLRQELLDPVLAAMSAYQGGGVQGRFQKEPEVKFTKSGADILRIDPLTGELSMAHKADRPDPNRSVYKTEYEAALDRLNKARLSQAQALPTRRDEFAEEIKNAEDAARVARDLLLGGARPVAAPAVPPPGVAAPELLPFMQIGAKDAPLVSPQQWAEEFDAKRNARLPAPAPAARPVKPGQRGRLTVDLAREYMKRANGDRRRAEQMALDDGFTLD